MPSRNQIEGRGGPKVVSKGSPATANMRGIRGYGRTDSSGRSGFGATKPFRPGTGTGTGTGAAAFHGGSDPGFDA